MTAPDPSKTERPASPACVVRVQQRGESEAHSLPQEEPSLDLRVKKNEPVTRGTHDPHAQRFGPKEEDWLFGNRSLWPLVVSYIIADYRQGNSDTGEDPSASHVKSGSSVTNEAPVNEIGTKCYYCIASETHAPHLHNVRLCTCAFRSDRGIGSTSTESATVLNTTSSAPRFDPTQLLRRSTYSSGDLVPVNGPNLSVAGMAVSRPRHNAMDLLPLSRFSMAGTGAAPYNRPRSIPSSYASGLPREGISSIRPVVRRDDPKGERPASTNDEGSLMTARGIPPLTPRSPRGPSAPPSPSDPSTAEPGSDDDDEVTLAGNVDDDQSSHTTAPSASSDPLETSRKSRKRRRRNPTVDDSRPRSATTCRIHQRRRLETSGRRAGSAPQSLAERACCAYILTRTANNNPRAVPEPPLPHGNAIEPLEQSHQRVIEYIASCFASNQRLRFELAAVREENERLEERLMHAERDASRYWEMRTMT